MINKCFWGVSITVLLVLALSLSMFGQGVTAIYGNLSGVVTDSTGAVVPGAKVTVVGPTGNKVVTSEQDGRFGISTLTPGTYSLKVEKQGFRAAEAKGIEVVINKTSSITIGLQPGSVSEVVEVSAAAVTVDTASTSVSTNLSDNFYQAVPVQRNVASLFYASPGVAAGGGTGAANPSISGGSGLENLYVADGVDITDTSFGGLGTYNRNYGSLGTGINLSFIKEVQVKTAGYEPQYGKSTGGIVQIVTKTGSNEYHGAVAGYFAPTSLEATRRLPNDPSNNLVSGFYSQRIHNGNYEASAEFGGYVPGLKNKVFFFGSFDPTFSRNVDTSSPVFGLGQKNWTMPINTYSYSAKGTFRISDAHTVEASIFGDPAKADLAPWRSLLMDNTSAFVKQDYGSRSITAHYNGTLTPTWLLNVAFSWMHNHFNETAPQTFDGLPNYWILNATETAGLPGQRGQYTQQGLGYYENTKSDDYGFDVNTSKVAHMAGEHTLSLGYKLGLPRYDPFKDRTGAHFAIPSNNMDGSGACPGVDCYLGPDGAPAAGKDAYVQFRLRIRASCAICPVMNIPGFAAPQPVAIQVYRGEFGPNAINTEGTYHSAFVNDAWTINKHISINAGLRWEQQHMKGDTLSYTFTDNWSPRVGFSVDPKGDRKTKLYAQFSRLNYAIPLDMAERSLSNELDWIAGYFAPASTGGVVDIKDGLLNVIPDSAHLLSGVAGAGNAGGGFATSSQAGFSGTGIASGTKMQYLDEFVAGGEREIWGGVILSARYVDRRLKRIVEDTAGVSPEAYNAGVAQNYFISNPGPKTDLFTNPIQHIYPMGGTIANGKIPASCIVTDPTTGKQSVPFSLDPVEDTFGTALGAVCVDPLGVNGQDAGAPIPDGVPDGFPAPVRRYQAVEIEVNKSFSKNWLMRANWRIAKLYGNYEGAFRNDNGQSDPSISSLYDFVAGQFNLLGDQFKPGVLNTDRKNVINGFFSYVFDKTMLKGLTLGTGVRVESGIPFNDLKAHPAYLNAGEIPTGGRGSLGRANVDGQVDAHVEYSHAVTEKTRIRFGGDFFNIANSKTQLLINQNEDSGFGIPNLDFQKASQWGRGTPGYQVPFNARFMVKFEF